MIDDLDEYTTIADCEERIMVITQLLGEPVAYGYRDRQELLAERHDLKIRIDALRDLRQRQIYEDWQHATQTTDE
jgi:hypothetical protein